MKTAHTATARICVKPVSDVGELLNDRKENIYQYIISICLFISIVSLLILCSVVPSLYNYVNNVSEFGRKDFTYCEVTSTFAFSFEFYKLYF